MNRDQTVRGAALALLAAGAACTALALPLAHAEPTAPEPAAPVEPATPSTPTPAPEVSPVADAPGPTDATAPTESPAASPTAVPAAAADGCTAAALSSTINSVTGALSTYFEKNPDVNAALLEATRQPAFVAVGQMDGYFADHPQQADEVRAIKAPLNDFQNRCGLQVSPAEALVALSNL